MAVNDCRKLLVELRLLENLKLFKFIFDGWPAIEDSSKYPNACDGAGCGCRGSHSQSGF